MSIKNYLSILSLFILLLSSNVTVAKPIVILEDNKENYVQTDDGYVLHFMLKATFEELNTILDKISSISDRVNLKAELISEGNYECVYTIAHQNQPEYVHKMMLSSGFEVLNYKGNPYGIIKIVEILYSYL